MLSTPVLRLSVLDQSPLGEDMTPADALRHTLALARHTDALGYHRFWHAEHHGSASFAGSAPEIMTALVLENTTRLRVGTGGILLPRYHPEKVAETMGTLLRLHPGRVDVGIGRGGGPAPDFDQKVATLHQRLLDIGHDDRAVGEPAGRLWLLGAGGSTAPLAGHLGAGYAFGHFFAPKKGPAALSDYRQHLRPGHPGGTLLTVRAVTAEDPERAAALAQAMLLWRARKDLGHDAPIPALTTLARHDWSTAEHTQAALHASSLIHGTPQQVRERLIHLARAHGVTEVMVNTLTADPDDRLASYELLAAQFDVRHAFDD
ncbi:MsnO8 family LLM class oxidoreductase [Streptosporangium sp. NBC_01756]|uniref:MsnO8 family LLM class oxidoreductase n=1 Tax=Streptosporangium sp. NBC_01756 TaxID=2975950 RepID=UPI002DDB744E|nr:MsnO8 family LLM class oxidoreductase [Streptosporangium sp. NBC_01756]WSC90086.1 MsnO8 family LLM class oxidoreductase [Streptosporangium sp. NBC_01756]